MSRSPLRAKAEAIVLCQWYLSIFTAGTLPKTPFKLSEGITVIGEGFYQSLHREALRTIAYHKGEHPKPCFRESALLTEIRVLQEMCKESAIVPPSLDEDVDF